jgi:hypothetical protein
LFVFDPGVTVTVPLVFNWATFIVNWFCNVACPAPPSVAVNVNEETAAVPEKFTPIHAVVEDEPGSRLVTLNIAVPVEVADPP